MNAERTKYSAKIAGSRRNYDWAVRFDFTGQGGHRGFLGITQFDGDEVKDRVLLSPGQAEELIAFVSNKKRS